MKSNTASAKPVGTNIATKTQQQKRVQARRQQSRGVYNPEEGKGRGKLASSSANWQEEVKLVKLAARQNLGNVQYDSRQEPLTAHSEQTTFKSNQRKENKNLVGGNSLTKLGGASYRNSTDQLAQQVQKGQPVISGNNQMQKKQATAQQNKTAESKLSVKRQARTTHHSRQISWSRDQNSDMVASVGNHIPANTTGAQNSIQQSTNEPSQGSFHQHQVTAAQKAHQSQKSKTTQSILKRLKQNIDENQVAAPSSAAGPTNSSALPTQISDAYATSYQGKKANSAATTMHGPGNPISMKLSTIMEKNSNQQRIVKSFMQPPVEAHLTTGSLSQNKKAKARTSSQVNSGTMQAHAQTMPQETVITMNTDAIKHQLRIPRNKDTTIQQRQQRQQDSPQNSQPINLISSLRSSIDGGAQHASHRQNNPYVGKEPGINDELQRYQTVVVNKKEGGLKQGKFTSNQIEMMRASFNGGSGDAAINHCGNHDKKMITTTSGHHMVVKKANIVQDGCATVQHKTSKFNNSKALVKKTVVLQGRSSQQQHHSNEIRTGQGCDIYKQEGPCSAQMATAVQQARHNSGPTSQTRSKNHVEKHASREQLQQNQIDNPKLDTYFTKKSTAGPNNAAVTFTFIKKQQQQQMATQSKETRVPLNRKAKTTYARTPASFRSTSGGKPSTQCTAGGQIIVSQQTEMMQKMMPGCVGGISVTHANSPDLTTMKSNVVQKPQQHRLQAPANRIMSQAQQLSLKTGKAGVAVSKNGSNKTRQSHQTREQKVVQQQVAATIALQKQQSLPHSGAQSFGSLSTKQQMKPHARNSSKTITSKDKTLAKIKPNIKGGSTDQVHNIVPGSNHKRSISYKGNNQEAISLIQSMHVTQNQNSSPIQVVPGMQLVNNYRVNFDYEHLLNKNNNQFTAAGGQKNNHGLISPLRTKQPSANNSRKISKERDFSKQHSLNSVTSPRPVGMQQVFKTGGAQYAPVTGVATQAASQNQSRQQSSFLTKANHRSYGSNSITNSREHTTSKSKDMQKILKNFIKESKKMKGSRQQHLTDAPATVSKQVITGSHRVAKPTTIKHKHPSSITSLSSKGKQQKTQYSKVQMQRVLGNRQSPMGDVDPLDFQDPAYLEAKDMRTFQEHQHREQDTFHHNAINSFQNVSAGGFAQEKPGSRKPCSAFLENDIVSGTYIATKSNDKMKVYPECVQERLRSLIPPRMRVSRVPTTNQLMATSFEDQVTIKPGDHLQMQNEEQIEQVEQISVLDDSFKDEVDLGHHSPHLSQRDSQGIFQAFNEYVNQQDALASGQIPNKKQQQEKPINFKPQQDKKTKKVKVGRAPVIDFHPSQPNLGEVSQPLTELAKLKSGKEEKVKGKQEVVEVEQSDEEESDFDYDDELYQVYDPLLEDKQYLVTMIVTYFQKMGRPMATTHEFYRIGNQLGEGAFGKVVIAQHKLSGHFVAIKCMRKRDMKKMAECKKKVAQDLQILQHLTHHRNVVKLYDSFYTRSHLCFVMELCSGGDLLSFVRRRKRLEEDMAKFLFMQIAKGLSYCHRHHVMHRDIKLENLLLDEEGSVKLCDFGVSQHLSSPNELVKDQCGTPAYMAPEVYACQGEFSGQQADVWSLGVCLYAMLYGMVPFKGRGLIELKDAILHNKMKYVDEEVMLSQEAKHLIKLMLRKDPSKRATLSQVLHHPWLKDCPISMAIFSNSELKKTKTMSNPVFGGDEPQRLLTEVELTNRSLSESEKKRKKEEGSQYELDRGQKTDNVTERSNVLAPFNSTITNEDFQRYFCDDLAIEDARIIKFSDKVREANRQYEFNYNDEVDNGIMISINNAEKEAPLQKDKDKKNSDHTDTSDEWNPLQQHRPQDMSLSQEVENQGVASSPPTNRKLTDNQQQKVSLAAAGGDKSANDESMEVQAQPVINFNGVKQVGFMVAPSKELKPAPFANPKTDKKVGAKALKGTLISEESNENDQAISQLIEKQMNDDITDDDEDQIDNIIVCKIENEFGYPEDYLLDCLKSNVKNDATTCYHLFCKEDKHEQVHLISYSPKRCQQQLNTITK